MQGGVRNQDILYPDLSYKIIGILFEVNNLLGPGLLEKHYQKALEISFKENKIKFIPQCPYKVSFKGQVIGRYFMDFVIEEKIVVELKRGEYFSNNNIKQLLGYLKITNLKLGLLVSITSNGLKYKRILNIY